MARKQKLMIKVVVSLLVCSSVCRVVRAQDTTAKIIGQVSDKTGAVIPDAAITVTNTATGVTNTTKTDKNGSYQVNQLPIGAYTVQASEAGFATTTSPTYQLEINASQRVDFKLPVEGSQQSVQVTIQAAQIDTESSTVGGSVTARPLVDLPLNGRNILDLAQLQPGVTLGNPDNTSAGNVSIAGGRTDSVTYLLDGGNNTSLLNNGVVFNPNPDAVEEFRILENSYSAEYGRNGGGVITVVSKSGTDKYHGTLFEFNRNPDFNANDFFNKRNDLPRNNLKRNQFGATIGGEMFVPKVLPRKDRYFFFFSYQGQRQTNSVINGSEQVYTTAELNGDFSTAGTDGGPDPAIALFLQQNPYFQADPAKAANAIMDPTKIDPTAQKYIAAGLIPSSPTGFIAPVGSSTLNFDQYNAKFDLEITPQDRISVSMAHNNQPELDPFNGGATTVFPTTSTELAKVINIEYTRTFSPTVLNEFRVVAQRLLNTQDVPAATLPTPSQLGIGITPDQVTGPTRLVDIPSALTIGFSPQGPTTLTNNTFAYSDNVTWTKGSNNLKFGVYFSPYQNNTKYDFYVDGTFYFYGLANYTSGDPAFATVGSATGYAEFLAGSPDEYLQFGAAPSNVRTKDTALFAQDDWHALKNLTLNLGLRYEYGSPKYDTQGRSFSLISGAQSTRFIGAPEGLLFPGDKGAPTGANFPVKNDFAPRFGFAYDVGGKGTTVVRGGVGMFFDILKGEDNLQFNGQAPFFGYSDLFFTPPGLPPSTSYPNGTPSLTTTGTGYYQDPYGSTGSVNTFPSKPPSQNLNFGASGFLPFGGGGVYFVDPHLRTPYTIQYNLGVQRSLGQGVTAEAAYVASVSRKYTALADSNPFVIGSATDRLYDQANGGDGNYSYLDTFRNVTSENYNSLQTSLRKQTGRLGRAGTVYFQLSYTLAKNMDNVSGFRQRNSEVPYYNTNLFYAPSDADVRNRVVFSGGWDLPFDEAFTRAPKMLTQGWSLYPIASWQSGFPIDVNANLSRSPSIPGPSGAGDSELVHTNLVGNKVQIFSPHKNTAPDGGAVYISAANFSDAGLVNDPGVLPTNPTYGSLPRNSFYGPTRENIDMTIAKSTNLTGGDRPLNVELRADFFNMLNSPEFAQPNTTFGASNFGEITTTYTDSYRIIQLAGKFRF